MKSIKNNRTSQNKDLIKKIFFIMLTIIPPLICLIFIYVYGVNFIFWDEWTMVSLAKKLEAGQTTFNDFWVNHNEHRIFFPKIVYLILAKLTGFNSKAQMYFSYFHILIFYFLTAKYIRSITKGRLYFLQLICIGLILFNLSQSANLLWGFQIGFFMCWFYSVLSIYLYYLSSINNKNRYLFIGSIISGIVASFSSLQGLMVWPALIISIILCMGIEIFKNKRFQILTITSVLACAVYFFKFDSTHAKTFISRSITIFIGNIFSFIKSCFNLIGSSISASPSQLLIAGIVVILFVLFIIILIFRKVIILQEKDIFSLGLFFYGFFFVCIISIGRVDSNGVASRYMTFTKLVVIGIFLFIFTNSFKGYVRYICTGFMTLAIFSMISGDFYALQYQSGSKLKDETKKYYLYTYESQPDKNLLDLFPLAQVVRENAAYLKENNYGVFKDTTYSIPSMMHDKARISEGCYAAYDKNTIQIKTTEQVYFTLESWAVDKIAEDVASGVYIEINNVLYDSKYGVKRPDVAKYFNNSNYENSGFSRDFHISLLHEGDNPVKLKILSNDKTFYTIIDNGIVIRKEGEIFFVK